MRNGKGKVKKAKDEEVNGQGGKGGALGPCGTHISMNNKNLSPRLCLAQTTLVPEMKQQTSLLTR